MHWPHIALFALFSGLVFSVIVLVFAWMSVGVVTAVMSHGALLFVLITGLIIVLIAWANMRQDALSEEERAETRKAAVLFFGDDD